VGDAATGRIVEHIEAWDVEPEKVLRKLLKPSKKNVAEGGNQLEKFMDAMYRSNYSDAWIPAALPLLLVLLPDALLVTGANYVFQEGWLGTVLFGLKVGLWGLCLACAVTVAYSKLQDLKR
jgi:hypothetical protein